MDVKYDSILDELREDDSGSVVTDLDGLTDVVITGPIADNEVLAYDTGTSKWINQTAAQAGLATTGDLHAAVTVTDSATVDLTLAGQDIKADVKVDSINDTHIDWGVGANQVSADDIPDGAVNAIPTLVQEANWDTAYGWGDHSAGGYLKADGTVPLTGNWAVGAFTIGTAATTTFDGVNVTSGADPGHTHTGASLSGIDISADTNLAVTAPIVLTDDTLSLDQSAVDHGTLAGLTDDDHAQYALLAGRSGGQTLIGGTASGEDLTLQSTAHATKGSIILGTASAYDEVNDRLGIGTLTPSTALHVKQDSVTFTFESTNDDDAKLIGYADRTVADRSVLSLRGHWGTVASSNNIGQIAFKTGDDTVNKDEGDIAFSVFNGGVASEAMRIVQEGNVGIGTNAPSDKLHIVDTRTTNNSIGLYIQKTGAVSGTSYGQYTYNSGNSTTNIGGYFYSANADTNYGIYAQVDAGLGSPPDSAYAGAFMGGHVGIGTATPERILDIDTNSNSQGLRIRGSVAATEIADMYVGAGGYLVVDLTNGNAASQFIDLRSEDNDYGIIIRESDGTGTGAYANLYVTDDTADKLSITVSQASSGSGLNIDSTGEVYSNAHSNYYSSSTVVGFSSLSQTDIYTKRIGKTAFVTFGLYGTSNSTSFTFTLPWTSATGTTAYFPCCILYNNGVQGKDGMIQLTTASNVATCYIYGASWSPTGWTNVNAKGLWGYFSYQTA